MRGPHEAKSLKKRVFSRKYWKQSTLQAEDSWDVIVFISEREKTCLIKGTVLCRHHRRTCGISVILSTSAALSTVCKVTQ